LGVSACQWHASCEPTESADETQSPTVLPLTFQAALTEKGARQYARRPARVST